jgi:hypothetical protein
MNQDMIKIQNEKPSALLQGNTNNAASSSSSSVGMIASSLDKQSKIKLTNKDLLLEVDSDSYSSQKSDNDEIKPA